MSETRKIATICVSDIVGYSRLAGADAARWSSSAPSSMLYAAWHRLVS